MKGKRKRKKTRARAENSDKQSDKSWARARLIFVPFQLKITPRLGGPQSTKAHMHLHTLHNPDATPLQLTFVNIADELLREITEALLLL